MKRNENAIARLGAYLLSAHDGLATVAIEQTEQALLWLRQVAPFCQGDGEYRDPAADEIEELRATVAELKAELAAKPLPLADLGALQAASVHVETVQSERPRVRCVACSKIVAKSAPKIERDDGTWHAECWADVPPVPVAPCFEDRPDWTAPDALAVDPAPAPTTAEIPDFFQQPDAPVTPIEPADEWPQFAHLQPTMREWAIKRELKARAAAVDARPPQG